MYTGLNRRVYHGAGVIQIADYHHIRAFSLEGRQRVYTGGDSPGHLDIWRLAQDTMHANTHQRPIFGNKHPDA